MKSYLHGLTAKGAGSAIRPIVASFYAGGAGDQEPGALIEESLARRPEITVAPKPRRGTHASITGALDAASAGLMQSASEAPQHSRSHQAAGTGADRPGTAGSEGFIPLMPDADEDRREHSGKPVEGTPHEDSPSKALPRTEASPERTLLPRAPLTIRASQPTLGRPASAASSAQPDQIEIHIGRIEITAVTPPSSAPAPRPQQKKSLDLGEYLKGRDGRAS